MEKIIIHTDGGARGNPGPAGIGVVIDTGEIKEIAKYIGEATNNQAEYQAVVEALQYILETYDPTEVTLEFMIDSELVVEQLNGNYKVKNEGLIPLYQTARDMVMRLGGRVTFTHITRDKNKEADRLVNFAIDNKS